MAEERIMRPRVAFVIVGIVLGGWLLSCSSSTSAISSVSPSASTPPKLSQVIQPKATDTTKMITFESLEQDESYTAKLDKPTLFVAGSAAEATHFTKWLNSSDVTKRIQGVDFNTTLVVAVFRGQVGSSGYGIAIQQIGVAAGTVQLKVNLTQPAPGQNVSAAMAYPYDIVVIPRKKLPLVPGTNWAVHSSQGKLLVETKYP